MRVLLQYITLQIKHPLVKNAKRIYFIYEKITLGHHIPTLNYYFLVSIVKQIMPKKVFRPRKNQVFHGYGYWQTPFRIPLRHSHNTGLRIFKQKMTLLDASLRHGFRPDQRPSHSMLCNRRTKLSNDLEIDHFPELCTTVFGRYYMYSKDLNKHTGPKKRTGGKFCQNE